MSVELQYLDSNFILLPPLPRNGADYNVSMYDQETINNFIKSIKSTRFYDVVLYELPYTHMSLPCHLLILRVKPINKFSPAFNPKMLLIDFPSHMKFN